MPAIQINTPFNLALDFEVAPLHKRILAYLIDIVILVIYAWGMRKFLYDVLEVPVAGIGARVVVVDLADVHGAGWGRRRGVHVQGRGPNDRAGRRRDGRVAGALTVERPYGPDVARPLAAVLHHLAEPPAFVHLGQRQRQNHRRGDAALGCDARVRGATVMVAATSDDNVRIIARTEGARLDPHRSRRAAATCNASVPASLTPMSTDVVPIAAPSAAANVPSYEKLDDGAGGVDERHPVRAPF